MLCTFLMLVEQWTRSLAGSGAGAPGAGSSTLESLLTLAALAPSIALLPVAVRVLAHPGAGPLPGNAVSSVTTGLTITLGTLAVDLGLLLMRWLISGEPAPPGSGGVRFALAGLMVLITAAGLLAADRLRRIRAQAQTGALPDGVTDAPVHALRPDLFDDLATLTARALPGSGLARGVAALNRQVDSWSGTFVPDPREQGAQHRIGRLLNGIVARAAKTRLS
ncbi:MAG: hypothetical protein QG622_1100 [Actinomycetota bacterium]|nr:hypothetical protein [Actinomycetota bacterium]